MCVFTHGGQTAESGLQLCLPERRARKPRPGNPTHRHSPHTGHAQPHQRGTAHNHTRPRAENEMREQIRNGTRGNHRTRQHA
eukprot:4745264-Prymnesium_polylepis.1